MASGPPGRVPGQSCRERRCMLTSCCATTTVSLCSLAYLSLAPVRSRALALARAGCRPEGGRCSLVGGAGIAPSCLRPPRRGRGDLPRGDRTCAWLARPAVLAGQCLQAHGQVRRVRGRGYHCVLDGARIRDGASVAPSPAARPRPHARAPTPRQGRLVLASRVHVCAADHVRLAGAAHGGRVPVGPGPTRPSPAAAHQGCERRA